MTSLEEITEQIRRHYQATCPERLLPLDPTERKNLYTQTAEQVLAIVDQLQPHLRQAGLKEEEARVKRPLTFQETVAVGNTARLHAVEQALSEVLPSPT